MIIKKKQLRLYKKRESYCRMAKDTVSIADCMKPKAIKRFSNALM